MENIEAKNLPNGRTLTTTNITYENLHKGIFTKTNTSWGPNRLLDCWNSECLDISKVSKFCFNCKTIRVQRRISSK